MNILFFPSDNDKASGAFLSMAKLAACLKNNYNHNVYVVLSRKGSGQDILDEYGIPTIFIRSYNWIVRLTEIESPQKSTEMKLKLMLNKIAINRCVKLIKDLKIDIVHINTTWSYVGAEAARICKVPYIWHFREFLEEDQKVSFYDKTYAHRLINDAAAIVCISQSIYNKYSRIVNSQKCLIIYNGVDSKQFLNRDEKILEGNTASFLIVGSISESKGQWQIIEACRMLRGKGYNNFKLSIVGKGNEKYISQLKQLVEDYCLKDNIEFCGFSSNTSKYYRNADITFVCSKAEAFGRVTVEAMLSGSLVIGADTAATIELIRDTETGLLYKYGDISDLTQKIEWVLNEKEMARKIAENGCHYMREHMSSETNAKNINELYEKVMCDLNGSKI